MMKQTDEEALDEVFAFYDDSEKKSEYSFVYKSSASVVKMDDEYSLQ